MKTAILSSIDDGDKRDIARGIVKFRRLFDFILSLKTLDLFYIKTTKDSWETMLEKAGISKIFDANHYGSDYNRPMRPRTFLVLNDGYFYESRISKEAIDELSLDWNSFMIMGEKSREIISETLSEISRIGFPMHYVREKFDEVYPQEFEAIQESLVLSESEIEAN